MKQRETPELRPGALMDGMVVEGLVGAGGNGCVYKARYPDGPVFAVKFLPLWKVGDWADREFAILLRLRHKNLVLIEGSGYWPPGEHEFLYLKLEFIEGRTLDVWALEENPDARAVTHKLLGVARALAVVHEARTVHRDIKELNIIVRASDGEAVVVDFGAGWYEHAPTLTQGPLPPGTPDYRSPEAWRFARENAHGPGAHYRPGPADDQYALGVVFYRLLTGRRPFLVTDPASVDAVMHRPPLPPHIVNPRVPRELSRLCLRMLEKDPAARLPDMVALCNELEALRARADDDWGLPLRNEPARARKRLGSRARGLLLGPRVRAATWASVGAGLVLGGVWMARASSPAISSADHPTREASSEQEVAPSRPSPEPGWAAAPPLADSTPATVAPPATPAEDEPLASYRRELEEKDAQLRWLRQELARLRHEEQRGPDGLLALFAARLLMPHGDGVVSRQLSETVTVSPASALTAHHITSYRATTERQEGTEPLVRVAMAMALRNPGATSWTPVGATLVGLEREVRLWPPLSMQAGEQHLLFLEAELTVSEAQRSFTLELWDESRTRRVTLHGITFPRASRPSLP